MSSSRLVLLALITFSCFFNSHLSQAQSQYQNGWSALNDADVPAAIKHFKAAAKSGADKESALVCLTLLHSHHGKKLEASKNFNDFMDLSADPYPVLYAVWKEDGVMGLGGKHETHQLKLLNRVLNDKRNVGKLMGGATYRMVSHNVMSFALDSSLAYASKLGVIDDWMMLGPFDNVMNSGYDKDFGVVKHPEFGAKFQSKYGAEISWFEPKKSTGDGYFFKGMYFNSVNSIIYTQTFVRSEGEQEVYLNTGYSGSLKIWLNDSLIYREPEHRVTEMDFIRFKCKLNDGYNRILVQLGEHEDGFPNFTMRFTGLDEQPLVLPSSNTVNDYSKKLLACQQIPFFADVRLEEFKKKDELLGTILLAKAYVRSNQNHAAEDLLLSLLDKYPKNYFVLRELVMLYDRMDDQTNQNKFYRAYEKNYPDNLGILENQIEEKVNKSEKTKVAELIKKFLDLYPDPYTEMLYNITLAQFEDDNEEIIRLIDNAYEQFPDEYQALTQKYGLEKSYYSNPVKAKQLLIDYLKTNYNYDVLSELASIYQTDGKQDSVIYLLKQNIELVPYSIESYRQIVSVLSAQSKYDEAITVCHQLLKIRPADYDVLEDLARLHKFKGNSDSAVYYFQESLRYFPFVFETNERVRDFQGKKMVLDLIPEIDPEKMIKEYETNYTPPIKKSFDIVMDVDAFVVYKSKATGRVRSYIIKINDEKAIKDWQKVNLSPSSNMSVGLNNAFTIKKEGGKLDAEVNDYDLVFTNLEIGDYVYVSYTEKQVSGGKSSAFIWSNFSLNSYYPTYFKEYSIYLEEGIAIQDTVLNEKGKVKVSKVSDFNVHTWTRNSPELVPEENNSLKFNDLAEALHISLDYTWNDIVQWYSDLSGYQATPDMTIQKIASDLLKDKTLTDKQKFEIIYEFVIKNIRYSSIDFRQSGYIPQKAADVYHSRLGDCKDLSTLFVSIARAAGLKANLVLVKTSNNGRNSVVLPSLDFNHCMVKAYTKAGPMYLELTDTYLPFGHLYAYHEGAAILEILFGENAGKPALGRLAANEGYRSFVERTTSVKVFPELTMDVSCVSVKSGRRAAAASRAYYEMDTEKRRDGVLRSVSELFKSTVKLNDNSFFRIEPRDDTAYYRYDYSVESDVISMGSFKSLKLPINDVLVQLKIFQDGARKTPFDYSNYEDSDRYTEKITVELDSTHRFMETPESIHKELAGFKYDLTFERISDREIKVERNFLTDRRLIGLDEFGKFKEFMKGVNDAENTYLVFR